jgi:hypothetical protein
MGQRAIKQRAANHKQQLLPQLLQLPLLQLPLNKNLTFDFEKNTMKLWQINYQQKA